MSWTRDLREGVRDARDLDRLPQPGDPAAAARFKVRAPRGYLDLVDPADPNDPIAAQVVPRAAELDARPGELADPVGDAAYSPVPRLTHRYRDRVLVYPTLQCAVYCRHCFRKEGINEGNAAFSRRALGAALAYVAAHPELREVILTGGDPLVVPDAGLRWLAGRIDAVPHVRLLRVHTRVPVILPGRVTPGLVAALRGRAMRAVVLHVNHPREITPAAEAACARLREAGFVLLNQSVLLRGVNDDAAVLEALCVDLLYRLGARPYYLHHCDLTRGLSHFRVPLAEGRRLYAELRRRVSGVCRPEYVLDVPGGAGKVPVAAAAVEPGGDGAWWITTPDGARVCYRDVV